MIAIGELSRRSGVNIETIRYYEREGVLPTAHRAENGRRVYGEGDVARLAFVRHARDLGFELPAVRVLLALQEQPEASCDQARQLAGFQLEAVESCLRRLHSLRRELRRMVESCAVGRVAECRVIEALAEPLRVEA